MLLDLLFQQRNLADASRYYEQIELCTIQFLFIYQFIDNCTHYRPRPVPLSYHPVPAFVTFGVGRFWTLTAIVEIVIRTYTEVPFMFLDLFFLLRLLKGIKRWNCSSIAEVYLFHILLCVYVINMFVLLLHAHSLSFVYPKNAFLFFFAFAFACCFSQRVIHAQTHCATKKNIFTLFMLLRLWFIYVWYIYSLFSFFLSYFHLKFGDRPFFFCF